MPGVKTTLVSTPPGPGLAAGGWRRIGVENLLSRAGRRTWLISRYTWNRVNVVDCGQNFVQVWFKSSIFLLFSELRMAVVLSDLRQHLEGQLAAKKTALVETEESLRFVSLI